MKNSLMPFGEAVATVLSHNRSLDTESVTLKNALGRFAAEPLESLIDSPPFDKSAMDGYAILSDDSSKAFKILETVAAGEVPQKLLKPGYCTKIMTEAMLPSGSGKVVRVEYTAEANGTMEITTPEPYENIIHKGENLRKGDPFFPPKLISPGDIGSLAASGIDTIPVFRKLRIGILTTGSELREPGEILNEGEIYNGNGYQLFSQIERAGAEPVMYGIIPDNPDIHEEVLKKALAECDLILLSGGVSMGSFDYVPDTLRKLGTEILIHGILIKPGRPTLFGKLGNKFIFGLPGNPVSTFMLFEVLVKPFIYHLNGAVYRPAVRQGRLLKKIKRRDTERLEMRLVRFDYNSETYQYLDDPALQGLHPVKYMGSAHLNALISTDGVIQMDPGVSSIEEGTIVNVRLI